MNTNKAGGPFGHPIIPDTHVHLRRMVCAKQKDLNEIGKLIFPISSFVGSWGWSKSYYWWGLKGTPVFHSRYSFYSFHRHKFIRYVHHRSIVVCQISCFLYIPLFFSHFGGFKPEAEHKDRYMSEYKTLPENWHICLWHWLQAQRKNG